MKKLASIFVLLSISVSQASPVPLEAGRYLFKKYEVVQKKHFENVYASNDEGKARLKELRDLNYSCQHLNSLIYQCSSFLAYAGTENEVAAAVNEFAAPIKIDFHQSLGDAYLVSEGDAIKEYLVPQSVQFREKLFANYRYIVRSNSESLFFGDPAEATFVIEAGKIRYSFPLTLKKSKNSAYKYLVLVDFSKD